MLGLGRIKRAYKAARLLMKADKAYQSGLKKGGELMADKAMMNSATFWGVVLHQGSQIIERFADAIQGSVGWEDLVAKAATSIGLIVAAFGARRAIGKLIVTNGKTAPK